MAALKSTGELFYDLPVTKVIGKDHMQFRLNCIVELAYANLDKKTEMLVQDLLACIEDLDNAIAKLVDENGEAI